ILFAGLYFVVGKPGDKPAVGQGVVVGEQGWSTEWASDTVGSRRGRQITLYRPSMGLTDYQMQFSGQIESKALAWVFRAADTENYRCRKRGPPRPARGGIGISGARGAGEFWAREGPRAVAAGPGAASGVRGAVPGPRFPVPRGGGPVDLWTDNRLKTGAV